MFSVLNIPQQLISPLVAHLAFGMFLSARFPYLEVKCPIPKTRPSIQTFSTSLSKVPNSRTKRGFYYPRCFVYLITNFRLAWTMALDSVLGIHECISFFVFVQPSIRRANGLRLFLDFCVESVQTCLFSHVYLDIFVESLSNLSKLDYPFTTRYFSSLSVNLCKTSVWNMVFDGT